MRIEKKLKTLIREEGRRFKKRIHRGINLITLAKKDLSIVRDWGRLS